MFPFFHKTRPSKHMLFVTQFVLPSQHPVERFLKAFNFIQIKTSYGSCYPNFCVTSKNWTNTETGNMVWLSDSFTVRVRLFLAISCLIFNFCHQLKMVIPLHKEPLDFDSSNYFILFYFIIKRRSCRKSGL